MDQHNRDLVRQLFTLATCILEDAHIPISEGQSARLKASQYRRRARELRDAANDLAAIAAAINVAVIEKSPARPQQSRENRKARS